MSKPEQDPPQTGDLTPQPARLVPPSSPVMPSLLGNNVVFNLCSEKIALAL